jgi:DNA-binding LytR/AlgR family response regulator
MLGVNIHTDEHEFFNLGDVKEIKYEIPNNKTKSVLVYVTPYGTFTPIATLEAAEKAYKQFGFKPYDQSHLINKRKVRRIIRNEHGKRIILDDGTEVNVSLRSRKK